MNNKRILFVLNSSCGGAERVTLLYAKILKQNGFDCKLVILHHSNSDDFPMKVFMQQDLPWCLIKGKARFVPLRLLQEIKKFSPDVVFGSIVPISILLLLYKFFRLNSSCVVIRMNTTPLRIPQVQSLFAKFLFRTAKVIISQTDEMKGELHKFYNLSLHSIITINNPIDKILINKKIKDISPLDKYFYNYVAIGRVHPIKGYDILIRAFAKVVNVKKNVRLYIVGGVSDTSYLRYLIDLVHSLSIANNVFFEGFQPNPYKYLYNADAFVLSSIKEGLPNVLLEALYLGIPVVSTRCVPFVEKIIILGENGFLVNPGDVDQLFLSMVKVQELGKNKLFVDPVQSEKQVIDLFTNIIK